MTQSVQAYNCVVYPLTYNYPDMVNYTILIGLLSSLFRQSFPQFLYSIRFEYL